MSTALEKRVQEALDQGTFEADAELRELLRADTAEARAALSLAEIDQALRGMARPVDASAAFDAAFDVSGLLARLDAPLDDIGDVTAAPSFDEDVGPVVVPSEAGAGAGAGAGGARVVDLASRRRWNAPLWLGGGLAAAAAFGLVVTTGILSAPAREAASVGSYAEESASGSFAPPAAAPMADQEAAPPADEPAAFADESLELERRQENAAPASVAAAEQRPFEEAEAASEFGIADNLPAGGGRATSARLRGSVADDGFVGEADESDDADRAEDQVVARTRRRARALGGVEGAMRAAEAPAMNSQRSPDLPAAPSTTSAVQQQGSSLSTRVMECVSGPELVVTLSASGGQVVRTQPNRTLSAEERRCVDRILLGSAQSAATRRMTFRR